MTFKMFVWAGGVEPRAAVLGRQWALVCQAGGVHFPSQYQWLLRALVVTHAGESQNIVSEKLILLRR
jgi:hypothetical protein